MTTSTSLAASLVVAISLALPPAATGQAVPRGSNRESSRSEPASSPSAPAPARVRTAPPSSQPAPAPEARSVSRTRGTSGTSATTSAVSTPSLNPSVRSRGVRAGQGTARPRPPYAGAGTNTNWYYPGSYYPSSYLGYAGYYPGYYAWPSYGFHVSVGFSYGYGHGYGYGYNPYGYAPYYGLYPHQPFFYGYPSYYGPSGYGFSTSYQSSQSSGSYAGDSGNADRAEIQAPTGSLRLRASPASAKVYIDGALAGRVADFDGLTSHLKVEAGTHELELRADGYQPYAVHVTIDAGKTRTERATLKKN